jgi:hypothetical protein
MIGAMGVAQYDSVFRPTTADVEYLCGASLCHFGHMRAPKSAGAWFGQPLHSAYTHVPRQFWTQRSPLCSAQESLWHLW